MALTFRVSTFRPPFSLRATSPGPPRTDLEAAEGSETDDTPMPASQWIEVEDYKHPEGWLEPGQSAVRSRDYCAALERGEILFFPDPPFEFSAEDGDFLLSQRWAELRMHKNVSYRPSDDGLR